MFSNSDEFKIYDLEKGDFIQNEMVACNKAGFIAERNIQSKIQGGRISKKITCDSQAT